MARYQYKCDICNEILIIQHLSNENATDCIKCDEKGTLVKLLTTFSTNVKKGAKRSVGELTEEFIQDARVDLARQKQEITEDRS